MQGVGEAAAGEGEAPYNKMGVQLCGFFLFCFFTAIQRARRAIQVAEGHQPSAGARSRRP